MEAQRSTRSTTGLSLADLGALPERDAQRRESAGRLPGFSLGELFK